MLRLVGSGDPRTRLRAMRDGLAAVRLMAVGAGLRTGLLDLVRDEPGTVGELARRGGWSDEAAVEALLRVLESTGLVAARHGTWSATRRGRALLADDVARASYDGFSGFHTALYRDIEDQLTGRRARRDVIEKGDVIARLSRAMDPFVHDVIGDEVAERRPGRILDVGCATGSHLVHMLRLAPTATGVGVETDPAAAAMARDTVARAGLTGRAEVVEADIREVLAGGDRFDLALLANVIYYLPVDERVPLLRSVAEHVRPGGAVVVVTNALNRSLFSRHFDLLLRAQEGAMALPTLDRLEAQLRQAGLVPGRPRRIAPGEPLTAVVATRPSG